MYTYNVDAILAELVEVRENQIISFGKQPGGQFDAAMTKLIGTVARLAMQDRTPKARIITANTGSSKTSGAACLAVAGYREDPNFSCTYICENIRGVEDFLNKVRGLLTEQEQYYGLERPHKRDIVAYSTAHNARAYGERGRPTEEQLKRVKAEFKTEPTQFTYQEELKDARIAIVTHKKWIEGRDQDHLRLWKGQPRALILVDEFPKMVRLIERTPDKISALLTAVTRKATTDQPNHPLLPVLKSINNTAHDVFETMGRTYVPMDLVTPEQGAVLAQYDLSDISELVESGNFMDRLDRSQDLKATIDFLIQCSKGMAFFSRQHPRTFISYKLQFDVTPGMVILDATADIAGVNVLMSGMELVDTPPVSFKNQKTYRIEKPKRFTGRVSEILRPRDVAHEYAELVKQVIRDTSKEGEQLLLIVPSLLIDTHQEFPLAVDAPWEFEQRQVFVIYWGCPSIGNSDWRSCTRVYCFEEFWMPRHVIIGEDLGRLEVTAKDAEQDGRLSVGASLVDRYKDLQERHLMRHQKQISCRGHVRELDPDTGECGHMTLYTTCDRVRFTKWFGQLYPQVPAHQRLDYSEWTADQPFWQAPEPEVGSYAAAVREQKTRTGVDRLIDVLELTHERLIDGARFEKITGLGKNKMIRTFMSPRVQDFITGTWWKLGWNSDVGLKGKGRVIYRAPSPRTA